MAGMDDYLDDTSYTGDSSEGGGQHMSLDDQGEGFYGRVTGNQDKKYGDHDATKAARQKNAAKGLLGGEKSALGGNGSGITEDGTKGARQGENNIASGNASDSATSSFKNKVTGAMGGKGKGKGKGKGGFKGMMRKAMPMILAAGGIGGFGAASFFGQLAMPFSLISQLQGNFDSISVSNFARNRTLTRMQMHPETRTEFKHKETGAYVKKHSKVYQLATGSAKYEFAFSKRQIKKLAKKGITVEKVGRGQVMKFKNPNGETSTVYADRSAAEANGGKFIDDIYDNDANFREAYYEGTKTWRQSIRAWFDKVCHKLLERIGVRRNLYKGFKAKNDTNSNKGDYESTANKATGDGDYGAKTAGAKAVEPSHLDDSTDPPTTVYDHPEVKNGSSTKLELQKGSTYAQVASRISTVTTNIANKMKNLQNKGKAITEFICIGAEVVNAVTLLIIATEAINIIKLASNLFEGIQKGEVEMSQVTPLNNIAGSFTKKKKAGYEYDSSGKPTIEEEGSAMEAEAVVSLYGNTRMDTEDNSIKTFNLTHGIKNIFTALGTSVKAYQACLISKIANAIWTLVAQGLEVLGDLTAAVACIGGATLSGGATCAELIKRIALKIGKAIAWSEFFSLLSQLVGTYILPFAASIFMRDLTKDIGGTDLGNALVSAGHMYMGKNHQAGGGSATSKENYMAYLKEKEAYIADVTRYERSRRSPFDATSPYTFMGHLLSRSVPLLVGTSSVVGGINNIMTVTGKAFSALMPGASAVAAATTAQEAADHTAANCPELDSVGAVGDAFCNPYRITDMSLIEEDPGDIVYKVCELGKEHGVQNFDNDDPDCKGTGNDDGKVPTVNTLLGAGSKSSRLMEYIVYCGQRDSPLGMADMNIANTFSKQMSPILSVILSPVPFWGGVADIVRSQTILSKIGYVTGDSCVAKEEPDTPNAYGDQAFTWEEAKYYQRFIEDQRYLESAGLVEKSSVTIALEKYYDENPLDESREGLLARMSGMTKEKVIATEELLEVMMWMANYNPKDYYPYKYEQPEEKQIAIEDNEIIDLEEYNTIDDNSWKYSFKMEYSIA